MCRQSVVVETIESDRGKAPEIAGKIAHRLVQVLQVATVLTQVLDGLRDVMGQ